MSDSPLEDEMEIKENSQKENKISPIGDMANAIDTVLSQENFDQKSNISAENIEGLITIDVLNAHMYKSFLGYEFPSLVALKQSKLTLAVSKDGYRSEQIVKILTSVQTNIIASDLPLSSRLIGKGVR